MKKKEMKKRIEDGFSQLAPDILETVVEAAKEQELLCSQTESSEPGERGKRGFRPGYALSACACFVMACLCMLGVFVEKQNHVFLVLDINPSIKIEINEHRQVEDLKGLNQDGKDVVKELKWKRKEPVQELLDVLLQDVVEKSYLRDNEGILVTLSAPCKDICENLENTLEKGIDQKLTELKVSGVTTAFRHSKSRSEKEGRKLLETELAKCSDLDEEQAQQLSVRELIQYCQDYTSLEIKLSESSNRGNGGQPRQKKDETGIGQEASSDDGGTGKPEGKNPEEKNSEKEETKVQGSDKKDAIGTSPEPPTEDEKAEELNTPVQPDNGKTEVENGKQDTEEGIGSNVNPAKPEEGAQPSSPSGQETMDQPETSCGQESEAKPGDSQGKDDGAEPGPSGIKENGTEPGVPGVQDDGAESGMIGVQGDETGSEIPGVQGDGTSSEIPGVQGDGTGSEIPKVQGDGTGLGSPRVQENGTEQEYPQGNESGMEVESLGIYKSGIHRAIQKFEGWQRNWNIRVQAKEIPLLFPESNK